MSNPMAGTDYTVNMTAKDEDGVLFSLVGATVTIEYKAPGVAQVTGVTPTNVNTTTSVISYKIEDTASTEGLWAVGAKVITAGGDVRRVNPRVKIHFDRSG